MARRETERLAAAFHGAIQRALDRGSERVRLCKSAVTHRLFRRTKRNGRTFPGPISAMSLPPSLSPTLSFSLSISLALPRSIDKCDADARDCSVFMFFHSASSLSLFSAAAAAAAAAASPAAAAAATTASLFPFRGVYNESGAPVRSNKKQIEIKPGIFLPAEFICQDAAATAALCSLVLSFPLSSLSLSLGALNFYAVFLGVSMLENLPCIFRY